MLKKLREIPCQNFFFLQKVDAEEVGGRGVTQTLRSPAFSSYLQELESVSGWLFSSVPDGATATATATAASSSSPT